MLASDIITRARIVLNDADAVRWPDTELLAWISDAQRAIAIVRPDSTATTAVLTLVAGTKQTAPTEALRLLDIIRNIGTAGAGGRVVRNVDRDALDSQDIYWHSSTPATIIKNFVYDNRSPKTFYVYPPATVTSQLEIIYSKNPTSPATTSSTLDVSDVYADPVLNYVLYRAYAKDAEYATNQQLSTAYLQIFNGMLGIKTQKDAAFSPDMNSKGVSVNQGALKMGGV